LLGESLVVGGELLVPLLDFWDVEGCLQRRLRAPVRPCLLDGRENRPPEPVEDLPIPRIVLSAAEPPRGEDACAHQVTEEDQRLNPFQPKPNHGSAAA
jgi:hypothetical protein